MKSVLVTGPSGRLAEYASAARGAGWEAREFALLRIVPRVFAREDLRRDRFDWICVASTNALPWITGALEAIPHLRTTPCAVVGPRTAEGVVGLGLALGLDPCDDASDLAAAMSARAAEGSAILCPRGDRSEELARALRGGGFLLESPLAYTSESLERSAPIPETAAVFFASSRRIAIAIGRTTFEALLEETSTEFFDTISLPEPTPEAFATVLSHLDLERTS
jgi:uroporphyrinogen-III synthase